MQLSLVIGFNLLLSMLLLGLAWWFWQGRRSLRSIAAELDLAIPETRLTLRQTTLSCQKQRLTLVQARYQYHRFQKYRHQLQQLLQLINLATWFSSRLLPKR